MEIFHANTVIGSVLSDARRQRAQFGAGVELERILGSGQRTASSATWAREIERPSPKICAAVDGETRSRVRFDVDLSDESLARRDLKIHVGFGSCFSASTNALTAG